MKVVPLPKLIFSLFVAAVFIFSGCSDSEPDVVSAKGYVVFDFQDEKSLPSVRLAAFAEVSSEVRRVDSIRIKNSASGFEWNCLSPAVFSNDKKQWSGYSDFFSPDGMKIPLGIYNFFYIDAQGNEVSSVFLINYNENLADSTAEKSLQILQDNAVEQYALYSEKNMLLYFGAKKQGWTDDSKIFGFDKKSSYYRKIYIGTKDSSVCIMPPVYKKTNQK